MSATTSAAQIARAIALYRAHELAVANINAFLKEMEPERWTAVDAAVALKLWLADTTLNGSPATDAPVAN